MPHAYRYLRKLWSHGLQPSVCFFKFVNDIRQDDPALQQGFRSLLAVDRPDRHHHLLGSAQPTRITDSIPEPEASLDLEHW